MKNNASAATAKPPVFETIPARSWIVLLCSVCIFMCFYISLNFTSVFGVQIMEEFNINSTQLSFFTMASMAPAFILPICTGAIEKKLGLHKCVILGFGLNILSALLLLIPFFANTYEGYMITRVIMGSSAFLNAVAATQMTIWFPKWRRGFASGLYMGFLGFGYSLTAFIAPRVQAMGFTWQQSAVIMVTASCLIVMVLYLTLVKDFNKEYTTKWPQVVSMDDLMPARDESRLSTRYDSLPKPGNMREILTSPRMWWAAIFGMSTAIVVYGLGYSLPLYFELELGLDLITASSIVGATFIWKLFAGPVGGTLSDMVFKGERNQINMIGNLGCGAFLLIMLLFTDVTTITILTCVAFFLGSLYGGTYWVWPFEMCKPEAAYTASGFFMFTSNFLACIITPICGMLIDATGTVSTAIIFIAVCAILSVIPARLAKN